MNTLFDTARTLIPFLGITAATLATLLLANRLLRRRWRDQPDAQFQYQLIMLGLTLAASLLLLSVLPVSDTLRGQLLSLAGILLSAAIALASTTFIGNIMAGVMLKTMRKARPGDFITVENLTGRITEMDLLHTEIQTEFRDLVTVPNSYMVSRPLKVVRASGSIITAEVSLGYDVSHRRVIQILSDAATASGLTDSFVHLRELGDYAVTYRVAGLLEDISSLISARSQLLSAMLDALHREHIEVVSPTHMATRAIEPGSRVLPPEAPGPRRSAGDDALQAEDVAFDKAEDAASAEKLRRQIEDTEDELKLLRGSAGDNRTRLDALNQQLELLQAQLKQADAKVRAEEATDSEQ